MRRATLVFAMLLALFVGAGNTQVARARAVLPHQFNACDIDVDSKTFSIHRAKGKRRGVWLKTEIWCNGPITMFAAPRVTRGSTQFIAGGKACQAIAFQKCRTFTAFDKPERGVMQKYTYAITLMGVLPPRYVWHPTVFTEEWPGFHRRNCRGYGSPVIHCVFAMDFWL